MSEDEDMVEIFLSFHQDRLESFTKRIQQASSILEKVYAATVPDGATAQSLPEEE